MKRLSCMLCLLMLLPASAASYAAHRENGGGRNYFLDSVNGSDTRDGASPATAWRSLDRVNAEVFGPGDTIFIARSTAYDGSLELHGCGSPQRPVIVTTYGKGRKPVIHANGAKDHALLLRNCQWWEVEGLEFTNTGVDRKPGRYGVLIQADDFGEMHHIHLRGISVHHVNGSLRKSQGGGSAIMIQSDGNVKRSRFVDLKIEGCHLYDCERNGISFRGMSSRSAWYPSLGVVIRGNLLERIPGDGIVPIACDGALVEENVMRDSPDLLPPGEAAAGIWPWGSDNTVIRYNEVCGHKAKWDGQGFDADYNCINTLFTHNYSHDNYGGFFLVCNDGASLGKAWNIGTRNVTIEYNVSFNDGIRPYPTRKGWFSPLFHISGPVQDVCIRYNYVFAPSKSEPMTDDSTVKTDCWGGKWPSDVRIHDNFFLMNGSCKRAVDPEAGLVFQDNEIREQIPDSVLRRQAQGLELLQKILERISRVRELGTGNAISGQPISQ